MKMIKMVDLLSQYQAIRSEIDHAIDEVLLSTAFINGSEVSKFASSLGQYLGTDSVVPCANGTDALQIALMALGLRPGDEVIVPAYTYVSAAEVVALLGLTPVFVDVKSDTFNIDTDQLRNAINPRTKAVVPVHLFGQCADLEPILEITSPRGIHVIEDAAQALGAEYTFATGEKKKAGTIGTVGTTSFFPSKTLGCFGDGGAIFANDQSLGKKFKMIANHGQSEKYHHELIGVNSRLDTLQAAVLSVKLKYLDSYIAKRQAVASFYDESLREVSWVAIPARAENSTHCFHQYTIQVAANDRDRLIAFLQKHGVPSMVYYPVPLHLQKAFATPGFSAGSFPVAETLSKTVISLPIHTEMDTGQLTYICDTIRKFK